MVVGELIAPVVVSTLKLEMLADPLLETKRNFPLECMAKAIGELPVLILAGDNGLNVPTEALIRKPDTWL
jgi:hypothetical protein